MAETSDNTHLDAAPGTVDNRDKTQKFLQSAVSKTTETVSKVDDRLKISQRVSEARDTEIVKNAERIGASALEILGSTLATITTTATKVVESAGVDVQRITEKIENRLDSTRELLDEKFSISENIERGLEYMKPPDSSRRFVLLNLQNTSEPIMKSIGGAIVSAEMDLGFLTWKVEAWDAYFFAINGKRAKFWPQYLSMAPAILYILNGESEESRKVGLEQLERICQYKNSNSIFILLKTDDVTDINAIIENIPPRGKTYIAITRTEENTKELLSELLSSEGGLFGWISVPKPEPDVTEAKIPETSDKEATSVSGKEA